MARERRQCEHEHGHGRAGPPTGDAGRGRRAGDLVHFRVVGIAGERAEVFHVSRLNSSARRKGKRV